MTDIQPGDDITIAGKVLYIYNAYYVMIKAGSGEEYFINVKDIKTHRPNRRKENDMKILIGGKGEE